MSFRFPFQIYRAFQQCKSAYSVRNYSKISKREFILNAAGQLAKCRNQECSVTPKYNFTALHENKCLSYLKPQRRFLKKCSSTSKTHRKQSSRSVCTEKRSYCTEDVGEKNREKVREEHECHLKEPETELVFRQTVKEECQKHSCHIIPDKCPELKHRKPRYDSSKMKWKHESCADSASQCSPRMDDIAGYATKRRKLPKLENIGDCKCVDQEVDHKDVQLKPLHKRYDPSSMKWKHSQCGTETGCPKRMDDESGYRVTRKKLPKMETPCCNYDCKPECPEEGTPLEPPKKRHHDSDAKCKLRRDENLCNYDPPRLDDVRCWKPKKKKLPSFMKDSQERCYSTAIEQKPNKVDASSSRLPDSSAIYARVVPNMASPKYSTEIYNSKVNTLMSSSHNLQFRRYYCKGSCNSKKGKPKSDSKKPKKNKLPKFKMPGCKDPKRSDCDEKTHKVQCKKIEAPYPSFSDCNPTLPEKEITECDMAAINMKRYKAKVSGEVDEEDMRRRRKEEECKKQKKESLCVLGHPKKIPKGCQDVSKKPKKTTKKCNACEPKPKSKDPCEPCDKKSKKSSCDDSGKKSCKPPSCSDVCDQKPKCADVCEKKDPVKCADVCERKDPVKCADVCEKKDPGKCSNVCEKKDPVKCAKVCEKKDPVKCAKVCEKKDPVKCAKICEKKDPVKCAAVCEKKKPSQIKKCSEVCDKKPSCNSVCEKKAPCPPVACPKKDPCSSSAKKVKCSSSNASPSALCKGTETCLPSQEAKKSTCDSQISAASRNMTSCPCDCDIPDPKKPSIWQRICAYFRARPNCPEPDEWKKQKLRDKAQKAAQKAGLEICDPKESCEDPCKILSKPKPNPCAPVPKDCCKIKKKKWFSFGKKSKCCYSTVAKRDYSIYRNVLEEIASDRNKEELLFDRLRGCNSLKSLCENFSIINFPLFRPVSVFLPSDKCLVDTPKFTSRRERNRNFLGALNF